MRMKTFRAMFLCGIFLGVFIAGCGRFEEKSIIDRSEDRAVIKIDSYEVSADKLEIYYTVTNNYDHDIWVCGGVNRMAKAVIEWENGTLCLRMYSSLPYDENVLYVMSPVGYYSKLPPKGRVSKNVDIELPVEKVSYFGSGPGWPIWKTNANRVSLQVGYITPEQVDKLGIWANKESEDRMSVTTIREVKIDEGIIKAGIGKVRIPVSP